MLRRTFLAGLPAAAIAHHACAATPQDAAVMAVAIDNLGTFDPAIDVGALQYFIRNMYDYLVGRDPTTPGRFVPAIAQSWEVAADGRSWTFRLDPQARFVSGNKVTADDVAYSFVRTVKLGRTGSSHALALGFTADNIAAAFTVIDKMTLRVVMPQPFAPAIVLTFLSQYNQAILDQQLLRSKEQAGDFGAGFLQTNSAGSGPFRVSQWRPNELIVLQRDEQSWHGHVAMRRLLLSHVPEPTAAELALEKNDVDLVWSPPNDMLRHIATLPDLKAVLGPPGLPWHIAMNVLRKPFDDVRVRQAMKYLVNYAAIPGLVGKYGIAQPSFLQPAHIGYTGRNAYRLDLDRAHALLAEAGLPDGFSTTLRSSNNAVVAPIVEEFQQNAAKVGVKIRLTYESGGTLYPAWRQRDYDMACGATDATPEADVAATDFLYNTDNEDRAQNNRRAWRSGWVNAEAVKLVQAGRVEMDEQKRAEVYQRIEALFFEQAPYIMLLANFAAVSARRNVDGVAFYPEPRLADVTKQQA
jgi:peptide/nickel transport system substrate-binding protein